MAIWSNGEFPGKVPGPTGMECDGAIAGVSVDGKVFYYREPIHFNHDEPITIRMPKEAEEYIRDKRNRGFVKYRCSWVVS